MVFTVFLYFCRLMSKLISQTMKRSVIVSYLIMWLSDWGKDMNGLGRVCFQKVVHQHIEQHRSSLLIKKQKDPSRRAMSNKSRFIRSCPLTAVYRLNNIRWKCSAVLPVLSCSLIRPLISSSWWRSEVSRSGRSSPMLGCSLAMVVAVLEGEAGCFSRCLSPAAWRTPGATHQYSLQAPLCSHQHQFINISQN